MNKKVVSFRCSVMRPIRLSGFFVLCAISLALGDDVVKSNRAGTDFFTEEKYEEALGAYRDAQLEAPESPELHFNIGDVLYKQKKYEEAQEEYLKALSTEDALLQSQVFYNIGNCQFRLNKLVESIDAYKKTLEINPDDMDAKHNLEFVRNKLKEMAEQQQQQAQQQQQQQQEGSEQQQQQGQQQQQQQEQQAGQEQQEQPQQGQEQQEEGEEQQQQQAQKIEGEMTEEEAQRILDALKDDEEEVQKEIRRNQSSGKKRVEKDW